MIEYDLLEAGRIVADIQARIFDHPDIDHIWIDYETKEVVIVAAENGMEYAMSVEEFVRCNSPTH